MELSERYIKILEEEGFTNVYEWQEKPGTATPLLSHKGRVSIYITDGSLTFNINGQNKSLYSGQRIDIPAGQIYSTRVGEGGAIYIVGEMAGEDT